MKPLKQGTAILALELEMLQLLIDHRNEARRLFKLVQERRWKTTREMNKLKEYGRSIGLTVKQVKDAELIARIDVIEDQK
jgi:hypothetical protein